MADVELVIKISEKVYNALTHTEFDANLVVDKMRESIAKGTPLPEGHGNLIDYDDLIAKLDRYGRKNVKYQLPYSPTIIFADKDRK